MRFIKSKDIAKKWSISDRAIRYYCESKRIPGAKLVGKTWFIPDNATKPVRVNAIASNDIIYWLREEKKANLRGRIYHFTQIDLAFNSNKIEGSKLTHNQTKNLFETNTIGIVHGDTSSDDIIEMQNHFQCFNNLLDTISKPLEPTLIKKWHKILKSNTSDSRRSWFKVGGYKLHPNEVGGHATTPPSLVEEAMNNLLSWYRGIKEVTLEDILEFHYRFENIHPFQDGNGRIGRLIMFRECLKHDIIPFIIYDNIREKYCQALDEWKNNKMKLIDLCLERQDKYKKKLEYFEIKNR